MSRSAPRTSRRARLARAATLVAVVLVGVTGCRTDASVDVSLHADGSGVVTVAVVLDAEAVAKVGDLSKVVSVDDLTKSGWKIQGPGPAPSVLTNMADAGLVDRPSGGWPKTSVAIAASRPFTDVAEANTILASISGPNGPLRAVRVTRSTSFASTKLGATGTVDLSKGLDGLGDAALTKALGGDTPSTLAAAANGGKPLGGDALGVAITVLPKGFSMHETAGAASTGDGFVGVSANLGDPRRSFAATGSQTHWTPLVLVALAVLAALGAVVLFVLPLLPGRDAPPPPARKRQRHSAEDAWDYVEGRGGARPLDPRAAGKAHKVKRGRHTRPRGSVPAWKLDKVTIDPEERVVPRPATEDPPAEGGRGPAGPEAP